MKESIQLPPDRDGRVWLHVPRGYVHPLHRHDELELNLVVRGRGRYLLGERRYDLRRNSVVWLFPSQDHILLDMSRDFVMWIFVFKPKLIRRTCREAAAQPLRQANPTGYFCKRLNEERARDLATLYQGLLDPALDSVCFNRGLEYALLATWSAYVKAEESPAGQDVHPAVERAAWILRDHDGTLDVASLGGRAGLSASRLSRLFKEQMGVPIARFRNQLRLKRFLRVYGQGNRRNILAAALEAGFGSYPQFHRVFKKLMGASPAEYRRGLKAE